ncbi:hypothetical protein ISS30_05610 [bacterium]|nr:hypothetical protein [FCB group bacterium]MBL7191152.1 hypothetical protein [bacterium]
MRCPECGRLKPLENGSCVCGFSFKDQIVIKEDKEPLFVKLFGTPKKRRRIISAALIAAGIILIFKGVLIEFALNSESKSIPEYFKIREHYIETDKYYLSSFDEKRSEAMKFKIIGISTFTFGMTLLLWRFLFRLYPKNGPVGHNKYYWK